MKKALIDPQLLTENFPTVVDVQDQEGLFCTPCYWVDCPDDVLSGYLYKNNNFVAPTPPITPPPTAGENKTIAQNKLKNSDWIELPSVSDPSSNPYLLNKDEWITYRNAVREIAVNPIEGFLQWPTKPTENWSS
jgi:hypothetical protein